MSDERLRELERQWRESGSVEDEALCLRERVRVGDLSQERLELAAALGHPAAASLSARTRSLHTSIEVLEELKTMGRQCVVRGALAMLALPESEGVCSVERWIVDPSEDTLRAVRSRRREIQPLVGSSAEERERLHALKELLNGVGASRVETTLECCWRALQINGPDIARRAELTYWLLGYGDPVRERVEARQRQAARE